VEEAEAAEASQGVAEEASLGVEALEAAVGSREVVEADRQEVVEVSLEVEEVDLVAVPGRGIVACQNSIA